MTLPAHRVKLKERSFTMTTTFTTPTLKCGGCAATIKAALAREAGVHAVHVTAAEKRVEIAFDPSATSRERLSAALGRIGYTPGDAPAPVAAPSERIDAVLL